MDKAAFALGLVPPLAGPLGLLSTLKLFPTTDVDFSVNASMLFPTSDVDFRVNASMLACVLTSYVYGTP